MKGSSQVTGIAPGPSVSTLLEQAQAIQILQGQLAAEQNRAHILQGTVESLTQTIEHLRQGNNDLMNQLHGLSGRVNASNKAGE
ncbi:hypothetical protein ACOMHN_032757 [Nucella lapillus]